MYESIISKNHRLKSCKSDLKNPKSERILWNCASRSSRPPGYHGTLGELLCDVDPQKSISRVPLLSGCSRIFSGLTNSYEFKEYCIKVRNIQYLLKMEFWKGVGSGIPFMHFIFFEGFGCFLSCDWCYRERKGQMTKNSKNLVFAQTLHFLSCASAPGTEAQPSPWQHNCTFELRSGPFGCAEAQPKKKQSF